MATQSEPNRLREYVLRQTEEATGENISVEQKFDPSWKEDKLLLAIIAMLVFAALTSPWWGPHFMPKIP